MTGIAGVAEAGQMLIVDPDGGGGAPAALLVSVNVAGVKLPTEAVIENVPALLSAVNAGAVAIPKVLVMAVAELPPPAKIALGPLEGAVNVTVTPLTGEDEPSSTFACRTVAKPVPTVALCGEPPATITDWGLAGDGGGGGVPPEELNRTSTQ